MDDNKLRIIATPNDRPFSEVRFTWSEDMQDCEMLAISVEDEEIDQLIEAKVHEGCNLEGWTVIAF